MLTPAGFQTDIAPPIVTDPGQLVPHNIEAEQALLGALVIDPAQMLEVGFLTKSDFYLGYNGYLYQAMVDLFQANQGYDLVTLTAHLEANGHLADIGGGGAIAELINMTPTSYGASEYADIVYRHSIGRQVIDRAMKATQAAYKPVAGRSGDMLVNEVIGSFAEIDATRNISGGPQPLIGGANKLLDRREMIQANGGQLPGVMTGIKTLDAILDGIEKNRLYLLAGRPGMGKSALALQMAYNMARVGKGVLLFSLEMEEIEITARLTSIHCGLNGSKIAYKDILAGRGNDTVICQAISYISMLPIIIDTTPALTVAQIRSRAQKIMMAEPVDLLMTDHGGLVKPTKRVGNSYNDTNQVAADMQALPKQLSLPVLCLVQLSRDFKNRQDKRPQLTDLRDTGKWEENADGILFIHREQYHNPDTEYPNLGEVIVAKNRAGASAGSATVYADVATNRFVDLETRIEG
jgi:replicative DNA helicase